MGMDLEPINPSDDAPRYPEDYSFAPYRGEVMAGRYNWSGWSWLCDHLRRWGVNTSEFRGSNDGEEIGDATCKAVADALEKHAPELEAEFRAEYDEDLRKAEEFIKGSNFTEEQAKLFRPSPPDEQVEWIKLQVQLWRTCGGYRQC